MTPTRLSHLAVLRISGADRVALLQGQTSNDARKVDASHAQLTSFSNPKGRCYAIAVLAAWDEALLLVTEASVAPALAKRLSMYVLRSKAKVELADELAVGGAFAPIEPWTTRIEGDALAVGLPGDRRLLVMPKAAAAGYGDASNAWRRADIEAGLPTVTPATAERFVPLWLGLERLGAIDFKKGCYTGQEIVARTHYLGQAKQQLYRARCAGAADPGTKLFAGGDQAIGDVVVAAAAADATVLLFVGREAPAGASITVGGAAGPALSEVATVA